MQKLQLDQFLFIIYSGIGKNIVIGFGACKKLKSHQIRSFDVKVRQKRIKKKRQPNTNDNPSTQRGKMCPQKVNNLDGNSAVHVQVNKRVKNETRKEKETQ